MSQAGQADASRPPAGLEPQTREAVRGVGQALLGAKRSYVPDPEAAALRDSVEALHRSVSTLVQPLSPARLQLQPAPGAVAQSLAGQVQNAATTTPEPAHTEDISRLHSQLATLRQQVQARRDQARGTAVSPSLLDKVVGFFTGKPVDDNGRASVVTPVTDAALAHLEQVDAQLEAALALPAAERRQQLRTLQNALSVHDQRVLAIDSRTVTPTLTTRTHHRRDVRPSE